MSRAAPVEETGRIAFWDLMRGIAVLGVLLANMPIMAFPEALVWEPTWFAIGPKDGLADRIAFGFVRFFADTKFITIFSVLFGAGLGIMSEKAIADGDRPFAKLYLRRLGALLVIGLLHANLIWLGDILVHYAVIGAIALTCRRWRVPSLLLAAGLLLCVGFLSSALAGGVGFAMSVAEDPASVPAPAEEIAHYREVFTSGDPLLMIRERFAVILEATFFITVFWGWRTLALFLVGIALVKSRIFVEPERRRALFRRVAIGGLVVGGLWNAAWTVVSFGAEHQDRLDPGLGWLVAFCTLQYGAALVLSPAYLSVCALWAGSRVLVGLRHALASVGRMALTNYLSHSIITAVVFNYLGYFGRWGRFDGLLFCAAIFAFQLATSPWWLARFRFGPVEWLWRSITYGRLQPMRRPAHA